MDPLTWMAIASTTVQAGQSIWNYFAGQGKIDTAQQDLDTMRAQKALYEKQIEGVNEQYAMDITKVDLASQSQAADMANRGNLGPSAEAIVSGRKEMARMDLDNQHNQSLLGMNSHLLGLNKDIAQQDDAIASANFSNGLNLALGLGGAGFSFFEKSFSPNAQTWGWDKDNGFKSLLIGENYDPKQNRSYAYKSIFGN